MQSDTIRGGFEEIRDGLRELSQMTNDELVGDVNQLYQDAVELEALVGEVIVALVQAMVPKLDEE